MSEPFRLFDLFSGAGGAARGYQMAGFHVTGVDLRPQPRYAGDEFILGDALNYAAAHGHKYDAIHASPPCQKHSTMTKGRWQDREHPDLIAPTRELLMASGRSWVIENVVGAPLCNAVMLCGTMFGLQTREGSQLRRHRVFEYSWNALFLTPPCAHNDGSPIGVYGGGQGAARRRPATIGVWGNAGGHSTRSGLNHYGTEARREAMGIDWMTGAELSEAIPPVYTHYIGLQLRQYVEARQEAAVTP